MSYLNASPNLTPREDGPCARITPLSSGSAAALAVSSSAILFCASQSIASRYRGVLVADLLTKDKE